MVRLSWCALAALFLVNICFADDTKKIGHSRHGTAFDSGMRTKPWRMKGLGPAPFAITTLNPEVQSWYDQGNALMHNFWFEEGERAFRWCHKLEPENPMHYFGMARAGLNWFSAGLGQDPSLKRFHDFLAEAAKRKDKATERERMYIEAWQEGWSRPGEQATRALIAKMEQICAKYPDDLEAKANLAFFTIGIWTPMQTEFVVQSVLSRNPSHPGAHHARIHNWDGRNSLVAMASCRSYGKVAPGAGHSLHMPGHIYSKVGMWHEAAISMDSATRVELKYMNDRLALPFETWNYVHNRDYLCYIQEQLGRLEASLRGSQDITDAPSDPEYLGMMYPSLLSTLRALVKFEKWSEILSIDTAGHHEFLRPFLLGARCLAFAETGKVAAARAEWASLETELYKGVADEIKAKPAEAEKIRSNEESMWPGFVKVVRAKVLAAEGKSEEAMKQLVAAAGVEAFQRNSGGYPNDPPMDPWPIQRIVGDVHFAAERYAEAIKAYTVSLGQEPNDAWSLAGLAQCHAKLGEKAKSGEYAARFAAVWSGADKDAALLQRMKPLLVGVSPRAETPEPERVYDPAALDRLGPSNWQPFAAPKLECRDKTGKRVSLSDYRGKNVLLIFYLSDECAHCMEQLGGINAKMDAFKALDTEVLAVSGVSPADMVKSEPLSPFKITLLADSGHANARRYSSYDDFEDMELHSTILIDRAGRVRWKRTGGEPFMKVDFLLSELGRWWR